MAAKLALAAGARRFVLVSALGADPDSRVFYSRVKGELERDLMALGFSELIIIRPSVLDGPRSESRPGEALGILLGRLITPLMRGGWAKYRPTKIDELAALMRGLAKGEHCNGQIEYQKLKQGQ
ncbi:MAG: hypothetical protein HOM21_03680, partial [Halobacteriovoraceae bacterium]|nr:hypothetical protein [Halobacteriovoraceae bacterium]